MGWIEALGGERGEESPLKNGLSVWRKEARTQGGAMKTRSPSPSYFFSMNLFYFINTYIEGGKNFCYLFQ
jgi:hypothetical protein